MFCDWYLEFTKPVLSQDSDAARETRETTSWVLSQILLLLNPFMPYVTEELHKELASKAEGKSLLVTSWPEYDSTLLNESAMAQMSWLIRFISEIRSVRADMNVPAGAKIKLLVKGAGADTKAQLKEYEEIILRLARLESLQLSEQDIPPGSIQTVVDEATLILPIADIIDLDKERERLKKQIIKLEQDIKKISQKLDNKKFIENAPEEIVAEQKQRREEAEQVLGKLSAALNQLEAA
jgi:valyl-tRNA synthetase